MRTREPEQHQKLTVRRGRLFLGLGCIRRAPDDVGAVGMSAHELCAVAVPGQ